MTVPPEAPTQEPPPDPQARPRPSLDELRDLSRLRRTGKSAPEGHHIAGVAGGLARHLDVDPLVLRVALVVSVFFGGAGLIVYAAGWLLIPVEGREDAVVPVEQRLRTLLLWVAAGVAGLSLLGDVLGGMDVPWFWVVVGVALVAFYGNRGKWALWHHGLTPGAGGSATTGRAARGANDGSGPRDGATGDFTGRGVNLSKQQAPAAAADAAALTRVQGLLGHTGPLPAAPPPAPVRPYRGPILAGYAIALAALLCGLLGMLDATGVEVPAGAYPALVLAVFAGFLVVGAFWGRAGGLVALSFVPLLILGATTAGDQLDLHGRQLSLQPHSAAALARSYRFDVGTVRIDLSKIPAKDLDGRSLAVTGDVGQIVVVVPDDVSVEANSIVTGPGEADVLGRHQDGLGGSDMTRGSDGGKPTMTLDARIDVGSIQVFSEDDPAARPWQRQIEHDVERGVHQ